MRRGDDAGPIEVEEPFLEVEMDGLIGAYAAQYPDNTGRWWKRVWEHSQGLAFESSRVPVVITQETAYALGKLLVRYGETGSIAEEKGE